VLLSASLLAVPATAIEDTPGARATQADRYLKAMPPKEMFDDLAKQMSQNMPPDQAKQFRDVMTKELDLTVLENAMRAAMIKHFTAAELSALADFYGSDVGRSAMSKFGPYMVDVMPVMQSEIMKAQEKMMQQMEGEGSQ
jgi:hypothetical protein